MKTRLYGVSRRVFIGMIEVLKSKSKNEYLDSEKFKQQNKIPLFDDLSNLSTFMGHPVHYCKSSWEKSIVSLKENCNAKTS